MRRTEQDVRRALRLSRQAMPSAPDSAFWPGPVTGDQGR
jgi:hypothetical protein